MKHRKLLVSTVVSLIVSVVVLIYSRVSSGGVDAQGVLQDNFSVFLTPLLFFITALLCVGLLIQIVRRAKAKR